MHISVWQKGTEIKGGTTAKPSTSAKWFFLAVYFDNINQVIFKSHCWV